MLEKPCTANTNLTGREAFELMLDRFGMQTHARGADNAKRQQERKDLVAGFTGAMSEWLSTEGLRCNVDVRALGALAHLLEPMGVKIDADFVLMVGARAAKAQKRREREKEKAKPKRKR